MMNAMRSSNSTVCKTIQWMYRLFFIDHKARNMWSQLSAEQKQNYGEEYFERALRSLEKYTEKVSIR